MVARETSDAVLTEAADAFGTANSAQTVAKPSICLRLMYQVLRFGIDEFSYDMVTGERCFCRNRSIRSKASSRTSISAK